MPINYIYKKLCPHEGENGYHESNCPWMICMQIQHVQIIVQNFQHTFDVYAWILVQQEHHGVILCYLKTVVFVGKFSAHLLNCFFFSATQTFTHPNKPNLTLPEKSTQVHWCKNIRAIRHRSPLHFRRLNHFCNLPIYCSEQGGSCCFRYVPKLIWNIQLLYLTKESSCLLRFFFVLYR